MQNGHDDEKLDIFIHGLDTMQINSANHLYECKICEIGNFLSPVQLTTHSIVEHTLRPCTICLKLFGNDVHLNEHLITCHSNSAETCLICSKEFATKNAVSTHTHELHSSESCNLCDSLVSLEKWSHHIYDVHRVNESISVPSREVEKIFCANADNKFACYLCEECFAFDRFFSHFLYAHKCSLKSMIRYIFNGSADPISLLKLMQKGNDSMVCNESKCTECNIEYTLIVPKIFHKIYCHGHVYCPTCECCLNSSNLNHSHTHINKRNVTADCCRFCDVSNVESISNHYQEIHGISSALDSINDLFGFQFECIFCKIDLKSIAIDLRQLVDHFRITHRMSTVAILRLLKMHQIEFGKFVTTDNGHAMRGPKLKRETDLKTIPFDPTMVKYIYSSDSDYDSADTNDEIDYRAQRKCHFCNFSSKSKYTFAEHLRVKHCFSIKTPSFECHVCKKRFNNNRYLRTHNKMVHHKRNAGKRYKCPFCVFTSNAKQKTR